VSRTKKGAKSPGYELNSRRPCSYIDHHKHAKRSTNKLERQRDNTELLKRISEEYKDVFEALAKT
jgi:hypothetical protein